ncbi:non-homologous end joining protein Ku [Ancylobacter defluvii]|uniref:Non-homologous end joining protein Ku n=1 Tax=Ancylobacter defluvii TaxID=1282440 RepID=A0A9W6JU54_9HYPH|nr:Ku protein [Ancylobacter defluvii]MBS7588630.1 Ku protein [Ancylobacter defluvii]GLK83910.1 non-homologous end joining protein Ku [Ancylobacter defluvii]
MARQNFWKGYLKLSLVTCAVTMAPATSEGEKIRFHTLNRATGNRVEARAVDAETGRAVREEDEVKGYELEPGRTVLMEEDELDAVALESTRTIDIDMFVPAESVASIWYDKPHFLTPADKVGAEAFSVIREAMAASKMNGIARLVLYRRERAVLLEPRERGIVLWTLHYGDEVRPAADYFGAAPSGKPDAAALKLIGELVAARTRAWDPAMLRDPVQENLRKLINARKRKRPAAAKKASEPAPEASGGNVVSITEALKRSLAAEKATRRS